MGSASSIDMSGQNANVYLFNDLAKPIEKNTHHEIPLVKPPNLLLGNTQNSMEGVVRHMRFYLNSETNEVVFSLGTDTLDDLNVANKSEWREVGMSGMQMPYIRKSKQSKSFTERQFLKCDGYDTASLTTTSEARQSVISSVKLNDEGFSRPFDDCEESVESQCSIEFNEASEDTPKPTHTKVKVPWECPYCDHTFERCENKNVHIAECRRAEEKDFDMIAQWVDMIKHSNREVMNDALAEAVVLYEEKVSHKRAVLVLLKQLELCRKSGTLEQLQSLLSKMRSEKGELSRFIPIRQGRSNNAKNEIAQARNQEMSGMMEYLEKGIKILKRKIATKTSFHIEDFTVGNVLSSGSFSTVHLAKCNANGQLFALKVMKREFLKEQKMENQIKRECQVMERTSLYPEMFSRLYFHGIRDDYMCILMEYVPCGDCLRLMKSKGGKLSLRLAKFIIASLVESVSFLHSHGVVHRDIKPDNVMLTQQGNIKLVDFGMSAHNSCNIPKKENPSFWLEGMFDESNTAHNWKTDTDVSMQSYCFGDKMDDDMMQTLVGNVNYAAPEVLGIEGYDHSVDWWAVGILYFHFISGVPPFFATSDSRTKYNVMEGNINWSVIPSGTSECCKSLISSLLVRFPSNRLGFKGSDEVKKHVHFDDIDFSKIFHRPGPFKPPVDDVVFKPLDIDLFT